MLVSLWKVERFNSRQLHNKKTPEHSGGLLLRRLPIQAIQTVLILQNSRMPWAESSRPYPERLMPPNGTSG